MGWNKVGTSESVVWVEIDFVCKSEVPVIILLVSVMGEQREEIEAEFREQLAEYDRKLSDAKREHTKSG